MEFKKSFDKMINLKLGHFPGGGGTMESEGSTCYETVSSKLIIMTLLNRTNQ